MGNAFHKKPARAAQPPPQPLNNNPNAVISDQDRAILQLKVQKDRMQKYTQKIQIVIRREVEIAKQLLKENKKQNALLALKRKKYQENLLSQTERQMENLEDLVHSIQFASVQSEVFAALSHGTAVLNRLNAETSIEDVEQLMEDTREAVEYQETVSNLLGGAINAEDQADIDRTISQWEEEELSAAVSSLPAATEPVQVAPTVAAPAAKPIVAAAAKKEVVLS